MGPMPWPPKLMYLTAQASVALHKCHVLQLQHARLFNYSLAAAPSLASGWNNLHCHQALDHIDRPLLGPQPRSFTASSLITLEPYTLTAACCLDDESVIQYSLLTYASHFFSLQQPASSCHVCLKQCFLSLRIS